MAKMQRSDRDLEILAEQIVARISKNDSPPTIMHIANYIDGLGFSDDDAAILGRLVFAKTQYPLLRPRHIVVLLHGIRTNAEWQGLAVSTFSPYCMKVVPVKYGFFDVISFWFPITFIFRYVPIRRVERELKAVISENPTAHVSVVAHSFGTYVISKVLKRNFNMHLFRLLMCGAIVPSDYDWHKLSNKPAGGLMNDVGTSDRLPILAESLTWGYGASGTYGFGTSAIDDNYHECGHSGFFEEEHLKKYWIPFLFHGSYVPSPVNVTRKQPGYVWELIRFVKVKYVVMLSLTYHISKSFW